MKNEKTVKETKVTPSIGGYYDLVSRARKIGLPDSASEAEVSKLEAHLTLGLPKDHPSNQKKK